MDWTIPGTVLRLPREEASQLEGQFTAMFLGGGMVLSQISGITGLEPYAIQNWVKRGFLTPPEKKRYSLEQLCRILTINTLKSALPMEQVCNLLRSVNGHLDDSSDDVIDDAKLYFMFVRLAAKAKELYRAEDRDSLLDAELDAYQEPVPGAKARIKIALRIMLTAWLTARMQQETNRMLSQLSFEKEQEYV